METQDRWICHQDSLSWVCLCTSKLRSLNFPLSQQRWAFIFGLSRPQRPFKAQRRFLEGWLTFSNQLESSTLLHSTPPTANLGLRSEPKRIAPRTRAKNGAQIGCLFAPTSRALVRPIDPRWLGFYIVTLYQLCLLAKWVGNLFCVQWSANKESPNFFLAYELLRALSSWLDYIRMQFLVAQKYLRLFDALSNIDWQPFRSLRLWPDYYCHHCTFKLHSYCASPLSSEIFPLLSKKYQVSSTFAGMLPDIKCPEIPSESALLYSKNPSHISQLSSSLDCQNLHFIYHKLTRVSQLYLYDFH